MLGMTVHRHAHTLFKKLKAVAVADLKKDMLNIYPDMDWVLC